MRSGIVLELKLRGNAITYFEFSEQKTESEAKYVTVM